jgi:citrate synthase
MSETPSTRLCSHTETTIRYRGVDLVEELLGKRGFMEVVFRQVLGRFPDADELALLEAVMLAVMEHGFTPSVIAARGVYMSSPENLQAGVAAGLLAVASRFVGTMEDCALLLEEILAAPDREAAARAIAERQRAARKPVPGFGHHLHPVDPRAAKLMAMLEERRPGSPQGAALRMLSAAVDAARGKPTTVNATGAAAAVLGSLGVPVRVMRGFALISRCAGLVAHLAEEQEAPTGRWMWDLVDGAIRHEE